MWSAHGSLLRRRVIRLEALVGARKSQHASLASLRQDPGHPLTAAGMVPDPWQKQLLESTASRLLLLCSRQAGKSTVAAALALRTALLEPKAPVLLLSPSQRQSAELFRKVFDLFNHLGRPMEVKAESALRLELANGSRIISLPGDEETIRGFSSVALLIIDEAARVADSLYYSVCPMLAVSQGRLLALSTPFGKRGWFYREWHGGGSWERIRITADQVPRIPQEFLERERISMSESWYRQEYCCDLTQMSGLVYPEFQDCVIDPCPLPEPVRSFSGVDFGFQHPSAVVFGLLDLKDVLWIVDEIYGARMTDEELIERVRPLAEARRTEYFWCDSSAAQSLVKMQRARLPALKANKNVAPGIRAVTDRIRTGRLKVFRNCRNLIAEAELYRYPDESVVAAYRKDEPIKESNHGLDALRYLVYGFEVMGGWQEEAQPFVCGRRPSIYS
jgi:Terminase RNaseH-like domain/Terminase large subunit, T4likevirus-type, N-terminal